jgi:hypothetical protein
MAGVYWAYESARPYPIDNCVIESRCWLMSATSRAIVGAMM